MNTFCATHSFLLHPLLFLIRFNAAPRGRRWCTSRDSTLSDVKLLIETACCPGQPRYCDRCLPSHLCLSGKDPGHHSLNSNCERTTGLLDNMSVRLQFMLKCDICSITANKFIVARFKLRPPSRFRLCSVLHPSDRRKRCGG